jgi:hypothetical protein
LRREALAVQWLAILALALAEAARFAARPHAPLWLDETLTGAIVGQPTFGQFWRMAHWDISPPLYYLIMRPWQALFGLSDSALRAPSLIFAIATPLVIAFARAPGLTRAERLTWAALMALWIPGIGYAQDARPYSLALLLAVIQTLAFAGALRARSLRATALWVGASCLTVSAHYDAALLALVQGLIFLGVCRGAALKAWPALLPAAPLVVLIAWQAPEVARYAHPDTNWYRTLGPGNLLPVLSYILGGAGWPVALVILVLGIGLIGRGTPAPEPAPGGRELTWTACATVLAVVALVGLAMIRPILSWRYLAPFEPGIMLGLVLLMRAVGRDARHTAYLGLMAFGLVAGAKWMAAGALHGDSVLESLNYEQASRILMDSGTRRLVFAWDNSAARAMHREQLAAYGGFFFRRAGAPVEVIPVTFGPHDDPNIILPTVATATGASILWIYDTDDVGTAAIVHPPRLSALEPGWRCQNLGAGAVGVVVCRPGLGRTAH